MPFNGHGSFSLAEPNFAPGTTISSAAMNSDLTDIADGLSSVLTTDGQSTMTGPIKAVAGTELAPGYSFAADPNSGMYRKGPDNVAIAVGGSDAVDITSNGIDVTGTVKQNGFLTLLPGAIWIWAGNVTPSGWLLCYGQSLLRADYTALFAAIGTTFGADDGDHFSLPDLRGRVVAGRDNMGGVAAGRLTATTMTPNGESRGSVGGAQTVTISQENLPAASLATTIPSGQGSHGHTLNNATGVPTTSAAGTVPYGGGSNAGPSNITANAATLPAMSGTTALGGSGTPTNKIQPTMILNFMIFAGV